ncbi:MAG: acyltransferase [Betaproteobacteria bacterium]|nr:acyltransferase [Betaproteobacteria bacterium]
MSESSNRLDFRPDIEGLRALAILLVIGAHAGVPWLAGGFVGVDVFFVLSGFLITGLLEKEIATTGRVAFGEFYLRRLRRLMPALMFMLVLTALTAIVALSPREQTDQAGAAAMAALWLSNIHFSLAHLDYFSAGANSNLFLHTWSLGVEEQFYLVWPALLFLALRKTLGEAGVARLKAILSWIIILSLLSCLLLTPIFPQLAFYMMPVRSWQFAVGGMIWLYSRNDGQIGAASLWTTTAVKQWAGWLGLFTVIGAGVFFNTAMPYPGWQVLLPTLGAAAIIWAGFGVSTGVAKLLAIRPLQAIGNVSYSWYLWHWPAILLAYALTGSRNPWISATAVLVSFICAIFSHRFVESPIRRQTYLLKHQHAALLGAVVVMLAINFSMMHWNTRASLRAQSPELQRYAKARSDMPVIYSMNCDQWYHSDEVVICSFGEKDAAHTAMLLGDSIAGQWFPTFAKIFDNPDWRLLVLTKSACPMVDESFFYERIRREYTECTNWRRKALEQLAEIKPDVVVLASASTLDFTQAQWTEGTARVLDSISAISGRIFILRGTPLLPFDGPNCLSARYERPSWLNDSQACSTIMADEKGTQVFQWQEQAGARFSNVHMLDMNDVVCPHNSCSAELEDMVVYRDSRHLTATFAESLAPEMAKRMGLSD